MQVVTFSKRETCPEKREQGTKLRSSIKHIPSYLTVKMLDTEKCSNRVSVCHMAGLRNSLTS